MPLLVCATPIGNLADVTVRVLECLAEVDLVLCEDTRQTRKLLQRYDIDAELGSLDQHRERARVPALLSRLEAGESIALVSDAGLPGLNDPGRELISAAQAAGIEVSVLPGPTAIATALVVSGLVADRFTFVGFVPRREGARLELWQESAAWDWPLVAFESPRRLPSTLASLASFDAVREVVVCRELTKVHEEVVRGSASELAARFSEAPKGEITLVVGPATSRSSPDTAAALEAVAELVRAGIGRRQAARLISKLTGVGANELYRGSLAGPAE
ncbi:MAG: 16S rRNA (cytidine(1402)-2'-O)-methyltransferase [Gaiellaceae bacterium]